MGWKIKMLISNVPMRKVDVLFDTQVLHTE